MIEKVYSRLVKFTIIFSMICILPSCGLNVEQKSIATTSPDTPGEESDMWGGQQYLPTTSGDFNYYDVDHQPNVYFVYQVLLTGVTTSGMSVETDENTFKSITLPNKISSLNVYTIKNCNNNLCDVPILASPDEEITLPPGTTRFEVDFGNRYSLAGLPGNMLSISARLSYNLVQPPRTYPLSQYPLTIQNTL